MKRTWIPGVWAKVAGTIGFGVLATCCIAPVWSAEPTSAELMLISTRDLCETPPSGEVHLPCWRLGTDNQWVRADRAPFRADAGPRVPYVFFVHGNRASACDAVEMGWGVYLALKEAAAGRPFRFVIWSWPSDQIQGRNRLDVQVKAARSELDSYYLAATLEQMPSDVPVCLIGYSFGARMIGGTLELLAGGEFAGRTLPKPATGRRPIRAALLAAAMDAGALAPGGVNDRALGLTERVLITCNPTDHVLRWYPWMYGRGGPEAMGFAGPWCVGPEKLELLNVACEIGRCHAWECYRTLPSLRARLAWYAFLSP